MFTTLSSGLADTLKALNLTQGEYQKIVNHLGRDPNMNELAMFSVLWSEHCCYKNSRHLLKKLPTQGPRIVQGPGENAGIVDVGDNIQIAFKIESHNHPTAVEPFQGATTGVGGILRDIFTMNARPIANLNALRFGPLSEPRNKYLFTRAVEGIAHYGNCTGVPTIAGEVFFDDSYSGNPLVNAMAIGILYNMEIMPSGAKGVGNPVLYVGSSTGKDGMGGAAFASKELDETSSKDRPAVQVGDPFSEKLLIEACLEAFKTGYIVSAQDMGAAGLTCSGAEMSAKGNVGMRIDLDKVPAREPGMKPVEYLLSESQERMLMVVEKGKEESILSIFRKWNLPAVIVGEVIAEEKIIFVHQGQVVVNLPAKLLTDLAPSYDRGSKPGEPDAAKALRQQSATEGIPDLDWHDLPHGLEQLLGSFNIAQARGVFTQYDRHVQNNTLLASEQNGGGVIRIRNREGQFSGKALAATTDCNSRYVYLEPYAGAMSAVAESARNLVCVGAEPIAVTDNLNFGNPEKADVYYQLYYAVEGIKDACNHFKTPVTGGNVSLYNECSGQAIFPAPVIGMVGLIEDDTKIMTPSFKQAGDHIALIGRFKPTLGGSEYQKLKTGKVFGSPPDISLNDESRAMALVLKLIQSQMLQSVQDISLGGLLVTLLESTFQHHLGARIITEPLREFVKSQRLDERLFGETNGSYLISYKVEQEALIQKYCQASEVPMIPLGHVQEAETLEIEEQFFIPLAPLYKRWSSTLVFHG